MSENKGHKFGTFSGVFTPSILTIFGLIMFMRTSYVVGNSGLFYSLVILAVAQAICIATGLSISVISTNTPVKGGGAYFLISRALGPGFGSAIGVTLFLANALSVPFYILGFSEAVCKDFPSLNDYYLYIALIFGVLLFVISWIGAKWAVKLQFFILAILALAIIAFMGGLYLNFSPDMLADNMTKKEGVDIFMMFAIFFPAVTGIMAGVNMSGDLEKPEVSIPRGTLLAIGVATVVYAGQMILSAGGFDRETLILSPYQLLVENALLGAGYIVIAGVISATLSSALGSYLGAPRILQALAKDKIISFLNPFSKGEGESNEPRRALLLTFVLALIILVWGGSQGLKDGGMSPALNIVAQIVTMFFLYTYGTVNLAAFIESFGDNPSFRPRFQFFHWGVSLFGAVSCFLVSCMINVVYSFIALIILTVIYIFARRKDMEKRFGDARRGFVYSRIRKNLLMLNTMPPDPKNWRPTITVLTGNPNSRSSLLDYARLIECNRGILSFVEFLIGEYDELCEERSRSIKELKEFSTEYDLDAFVEVIVTDNFDKGLSIFLQSHSIGPIKPNILMLGYPKDEKRIAPFISHIERVLTLNMSPVILIDSQKQSLFKERIDIWWRGHKNGSLMLVLAHLLTMNPKWNNTKIRILRMVNSEEEEVSAQKELNNLIENGRVVADLKIINSNEQFDDIFKKESQDAKVIFIGFSMVKREYTENFFNGINQKLENMPQTFVVSSTGEANLLV